MTPEERLTRIENLLHALTESQVQFQVEIQQLKESQRETSEQIKAVNLGWARVSAAQDITEARLQS
jgi:hypothetical protein